MSIPVPGIVFVITCLWAPGPSEVVGVKRKTVALYLRAAGLWCLNKGFHQLILSPESGYFGKCDPFHLYWSIGSRKRHAYASSASSSVAGVQGITQPKLLGAQLSLRCLWTVFDQTAFISLVCLWELNLCRDCIAWHLICTSWLSQPQKARAGGREISGRKKGGSGK